MQYKAIDYRALAGASGLRQRLSLWQTALCTRLPLASSDKLTAMDNAHFNSAFYDEFAVDFRTPRLRGAAQALPATQLASPL